jgi:hypothetical protein
MQRSPPPARGMRPASLARQSSTKSRSIETSPVIPLAARIGAATEQRARQPPAARVSLILRYRPISRKRSVATKKTARETIDPHPTRTQPVTTFSTSYHITFRSVRHLPQLCNTIVARPCGKTMSRPARAGPSRHHSAGRSAATAIRAPLPSAGESIRAARSRVTPKCRRITLRTRDRATTAPGHAHACKPNAFGCRSLRGSHLQFARHNRRVPRGMERDCLLRGPRPQAPPQTPRRREGRIATLWADVDSPPEPSKDPRPR